VSAGGLSRQRGARALQAIAIGMLVWSARSLVDYGALAARLAGRPLLARGTIASDEWADPLARAGRARLQAAYAEARRGGTLVGKSSRVASGWAWIVGAEPSFPPDARIYLDVPSDLLYFYGTTIWYPRSVEVGSKSVPIANGDVLRSAAVHVGSAPWGDLRMDGFTHVVAADASGLELIDLRVAAAGSRP